MRTIFVVERRQSRHAQPSNRCSNVSESGVCRIFFDNYVNPLRGRAGLAGKELPRSPPGPRPMDATRVKSANYSRWPIDWPHGPDYWRDQSRAAKPFGDFAHVELVHLVFER